MARYLSDEWLREVGEAAAASDTLRAATAALELTVQHQVTEGPEGDRTFHVVLDHGEARVAAGPASAPDVVFTHDYETAAAIADGTLSAQAAFMIGKLRVGGNLTALIEHQRALNGLDDVLEEVRARTDF